MMHNKSAFDSSKDVNYILIQNNRIYRKLESMIFKAFYRCRTYRKIKEEFETKKCTIDNLTSIF